MKRNPHKYFHKPIILLVFLFFPFNNATGQKIPGGSPSFKKCWEYQSEKILNLKYASDKGLTFVTSLPDTIQTININTGEALWKSSLGGEIVGEIIVNKNNIIVLSEAAPNDTEEIGRVKRSLISLNPISGITNWKTTINSTGKISLYSLENALVSVENGIIRLINLQNGETFHEFEIQGEISAVYHFNTSLIFGTVEKKIVFFSIADGKFTKEIPVSEIPTRIFISDNENVIWADKKGTTQFVNAATQKIIWKKRFGGEVSSITKTANGILISSFDNFIYLVDIKTGKVKWRKRLSGRIIDEPLAVDNIVVVFAYGDLTGLILDLRDGKVVDQIILSDANQFIGKPIFLNNLLIFPTLKGLFAFSNRNCSENKKTGE
jgi:outer membrane protein assembly factor BamB